MNDDGFFKTLGHIILIIVGVMLGLWVLVAGINGIQDDTGDVSDQFMRSHPPALHVGVQSLDLG